MQTCPQTTGYKAYDDLVEKHKAYQQTQWTLVDTQQQQTDTLQQLAYLAMNDLQQVQHGPAMQQVQTLLGSLQLQHRQLSETCTKLQAEVDNMHANNDSITSLKDGPCTASVEKVLQDNYICRQQYHRGSFIGNHIHCALKGTVFLPLLKRHSRTFKLKTSMAVRQKKLLHCQHEKVHCSHSLQTAETCTQCHPKSLQNNCSHWSRISAPSWPLSEPKLYYGNWATSPPSFIC